MICWSFCMQETITGCCNWSTGVERLPCLVIMDITAIGCWIFSAGKNSDKLFCSSKGINIVCLTIIFNLWLFNDFWLLYYSKWKIAKLVKLRCQIDNEMLDLITVVPKIWIWKNCCGNDRSILMSSWMRLFERRQIWRKLWVLELSQDELVKTETWQQIMETVIGTPCLDVIEN